MSTAPPPPIEPVPAAASTRRGCWKGALLGCGGAAVLCVAALIVTGVWVQKNPEKVTDLLVDNIRDRYASDVTEQDKADLDAAYAEFRRALVDRRVRDEDMERVRGVVKLQGEVRRDDVLELTRVFREAARSGTRDTGHGTGGEGDVPITPAVEITPVP